MDALDHPTVLLVLLLDSRDGCDHAGDAIIHITYGVCALFSITMRAFDQDRVRDGHRAIVVVPFHFCSARVSPLHSICDTERALTARNSSTPNASTTNLISSNILVFTVLFFHVRMLAALPHTHGNMMWMGRGRLAYIIAFHIGQTCFYEWTEGKQSLIQSTVMFISGWFRPRGHLHLNSIHAPRSWPTISLSSSICMLCERNDGTLVL